MYVKFRLPYGSVLTSKKGEDGEEKKQLVMPLDKYRKLREVITVFPEDPLTWDTYQFWSEYVGHLESILQVIDSVEIVSVIRKNSKCVDDLEEVIDRISNKFLTLENRLNLCKEQMFNKKINVHVPGNALLDIEHVILMRDCCTDSLSEKLSEGWRIIAVCPQPDQRRPDYILGLKGVKDE